MKKIREYVPAYPKLFRFCVAVLGVTQLLAGFYWLIVPQQRSSGSVYRVLREDMTWLSGSNPMHGWAYLFLLSGFLVMYGVVAWRPPFAELGLMVGAGVWTFFATSFLIESLRNSGVSVFVPIVIFPLIVFHLAFIVGLGNSRRR